MLPDEAALDALVAALARNPRLSDAAAEAKLNENRAILAATVLIKLGVLDVA